MKKILCIFLSLLLMASLLTACATEQAPYVPTGAGLYREEDGENPIAPNEEKPEQSLKLTYYPDRSLNPYSCTDFTNRALFALLYQSLFSVDRSYKVEPQLCKNYTISRDMKTYTFYLEQARFSDGTLLTAADVVASLQAARESAYYGGRFRYIADVIPTADGGVMITTDVPMEDLPILLDIPILKQNDVTADMPLGTGPYYVDIGNNSPLLRRNAGWWCREDLVVTAPAISLTVATDEAGIRDSFEFEGVSLVCADPGSDRYADYRCDYELWDSETGIFLYLSVNMESPLFSDAKVRASLTNAVDRDTLAAAYYRGFARSAVLPASPQSPYYNQTLAKRYAYDGGAVFKEAVEKMPKSSREIVFLVNKDDSLRLRVARDIATMLTESGLTVTMSELGTAAYQNALKKKEFDLYLGQTKLSPNMDLSSFFATKGALNVGGIGDLGLYSLCTEAIANHGNYYTLHKSVMDDGRLCPILFRSYAVYATRGLLTGLTPARDSVFYYSMGKTMESALLETPETSENENNRQS